MGSPVVSGDLPALTATADLCQRFSQLISVYDRFSEFLDWLLGDDGEISDEALAGISDRTVPVGTILMYSSHTPPGSSFMLCNGQAISRTTYADLFGRIGVSYGAGDSATTFNLPDLRSRFPVGYGPIYALASTGGSVSTPLDLTHYHGTAISSGNDNINFPTRTWSKTDNGTGATIGISGDDVDDADGSAITTGDIASTTEIPSLAALVVPTLPPYLAVPFIIKVQ